MLRRGRLSRSRSASASIVYVRWSVTLPARMTSNSPFNSVYSAK